MKKALHWGAFFVSALLVLPAMAQCPRLPGGFEARVDSVYDGDTLRLDDGRKVRLIGVNTPELGRDGQSDEPFAVQARQWLLHQVEGRQVYLLPGIDPRDRYGRMLAHLYLHEGTLAAEALVGRGLGYALAIGANSRLADCLFAAEEPVRAQGVRLWQQAPYAAAKVGQGGFKVVHGYISRLTPTRRGTYIDLDRHLAVFVPVEVMDKQPIGWQLGQGVQVRGWVIDRLQRQKKLRPGQQRWLLRVTHHHHLQVD